eukprot:1830597-Pleurochrysis_carterae.AAC.1
MTTLVLLGSSLRPCCMHTSPCTHRDAHIAMHTRRARERKSPRASGRSGGWDDVKEQWVGRDGEGSRTEVERERGGERN